MTKILVIKTSSMGDVMHTLPAVTDVAKAMPDSQIDWVVEERFASIPEWHAHVRNVIPVALRRWRKKWLRSIRSEEFHHFREALRADQYDAVIDAQGLIKSAWITRMAHGQRHGLNRQSVREPLAAMAYQKRHAVARDMHAVTRVRELFAKSLGYQIPDSEPEFGIDLQRFNSAETDPYIVLIHGTTWDTKLWPESYWIALIRIIMKSGYRVKIVWGNILEQERSLRISQGMRGVEVLPDLNIDGVANVLSGAAGAVAVDTGFAHLAQALNVPSVVLYGATSPKLTGPVAKHQVALTSDFPCAPCLKKTCHYKGDVLVQKPACFAGITPDLVFSQLQKQMSAMEV